MTVPAEASEKDKRKLMDALLLRVLGDSFRSGEVLQRQSLGSIVHIFSHIRMTLHVEKLVLKVRCLIRYAAVHRRLLRPCCSIHSVSPLVCKICLVPACHLSFLHGEGSDVYQ